MTLICSIVCFWHNLESPQALAFVTPVWKASTYPPEVAHAWLDPRAAEAALRAALAAGEHVLLGHHRTRLL